MANKLSPKAKSVSAGGINALTNKGEYSQVSDVCSSRPMKKPSVPGVKEAMKQDLFGGKKPA